MAGRSHQLLKHGYGLFAAGGMDSPVAADEFDESDIWGYPVDPGRAADYASSKKPIPVSREVSRNKPGGRGGDHRGASAASSLPVSIPDWSKILREEYRKSRQVGGGDGYENEEEDEEGEDGTTGGGGEGIIIPPHEYLWKKRGGASSSFSVHEGIGRTLKGRDLSRVRNAVWEKTGFQD